MDHALIFKAVSLLAARSSQPGVKKILLLMCFQYILYYLSRQNYLL